MATTVASRFAVLSIDDDCDPTAKVKKPRTKKEDPASAKAKQVSGSQQKSNDPKKKNKNKKKTENSNHSQANGATKPKKATSDGVSKSASQQKKGANVSGEQWEEWKKKDQEFVSDAYEQDLHEAVMQSKIEFEQRKKMLSSGENGQPPGGKGKNKKSKTMSLEQFNNPQKETEQVGSKENDIESDRLFFEEVDENARHAIDLEIRREQARAREPYIHEAVTIAQLQDKLEKKDLEIGSLKSEVTRLQGELQDVRARNSKLCNMLAQGEMKDKVGVLVEVEQLKSVREELTSEVQSLYTQLEQERSKVRALTSAASADNKKSKGKKKTSSESGP